MRVIKELYGLIDRTSFGSGPWNNEPDFIQMTDDDLNCMLIMRNNLGNLTGYIALPPSNKYWGKDYEEIGLHMYCGCTWTSQYFPSSLVTQLDDFWIVGFDCGHAGDVIPSMQSIGLTMGWMGRPDYYKDIDFVKNELKHLSLQL